MEHRCGYRRSVSVPVIVRTSDGFAVQAEIRNISASGALVRSASPLPLHARVLVQFVVRDVHPQRERPAVHAHVIRRSEEGFGLEWAEFSPEPIRKVLRQLSATPSRTRP